MAGTGKNGSDRRGAFVAVDWGTSSFRAWLMTADGTPVAESRSDEGMRHCVDSGFEPVFRRHLGALGVDSSLPAIICGMAGARQGWTEASYLPAPTSLGGLHAGAVRVATDGDVRIVPGIAQMAAAAPDVMRGEETQILGAIEADFSGLVCIPGTHSKWVAIDGGGVSSFTTYMTGELFSLIADHSVVALAIDKSVAAGPDSAAFRAGVADALAHQGGLTSAIFGIRASMLLGYSDKSVGAARLSGLLVGAEIADAVHRHGTDRPLRLIAAGPLGGLYQWALGEAGFAVTIADAELASRRGLAKIAIDLWNKEF